MSSINLSWDADGTIDSYTIYRSESSINIESLPAPLIENVTDKTYSDTTFVTGATYYYRIASVRNSVSKFSVDFLTWAVDGFLAQSNFVLDMTDNAGVLWNAYGSATISSGCLSLPTAGAYLHTSSFDFSAVLASSADFTLRFFSKVTTVAGANVLFSERVADSVYSGVQAYLAGGVFAFKAVSTAGTVFNLYYTPVAGTAGNEYEFSLERKGSTYYLYVDGALVDSTVSSTPYYDILCDFYLGRSAVDDRYDLNGEVRYFQLINGTAVGNGELTTPRIL